MTEYILSKQSSIIVDKLPDELSKKLKDSFDALYAHRPKEVSKVLTGYDKVELKCKRGHRSYMKTPKLDPSLTSSYMFSGHDQDHNCDDLPEEFKPLLDFMNTTSVIKYNQVVVNFYENGSEFIPMHSDCEVGMVPGANIAVINLDNSDDSTDYMSRRTFRLIVRKESSDVNLANIGLVCNHGAIFKMCGRTQDEYRHGVAKDQSTYKRISVTFRSFA